MDRQKVIHEILSAVVALEQCSDQELENLKRFLNWLPDATLQGVLEKNRSALKEKTAACTKEQGSDAPRE